jgi:YegS/Rv2252/BmrU family lipid kinase
MDILLYNPLSRNGKNPRFIKKIVSNLEKEGQEVQTFSLLETHDVDVFIKKLQKDDRIIIVGGDGTINRLVNAINHKIILQKIYMYQAGTGNDFVRSLKTKEKLVLISPYIENLPTVTYLQKTRRFLNGVGGGLDGYIAYLVNHSHFKKNKINYFRHSFEGFAKFKPIGAKITIDGKTFHEDKLWLASIMNGAYFGGGMKIAPKANREEDNLHLIIVKNIPKWLLILIFPTIYFGWHIHFKKFVDCYQGKDISFEMDQPIYLQIDGENEYPIQKIETKAFSKK